MNDCEVKVNFNMRWQLHVNMPRDAPGRSCFPPEHGGAFLLEQQTHVFTPRCNIPTVVMFVHSNRLLLLFFTGSSVFCEDTHLLPLQPPRDTQCQRL